MEEEEEEDGRTRCKYLHFIISVLVFQLLASDGINLSDAAAGLEPESRIEM